MKHLKKNINFKLVHFFFFFFFFLSFFFCYFSYYKNPAVVAAFCFWFIFVFFNNPYLDFSLSFLTPFHFTLFFSNMPGCRGVFYCPTYAHILVFLLFFPLPQYPSLFWYRFFFSFVQLNGAAPTARCGCMEKNHRYPLRYVSFPLQPLFFWGCFALYSHCLWQMTLCTKKHISSYQNFL